MKGVHLYEEKTNFIVYRARFRLVFLPNVGAENNWKHRNLPSKQLISAPSSVLNVTKENTYPNPKEEIPKLEPSELTIDLIESNKIKIENPELIHMLNESASQQHSFCIWISGHDLSWSMAVKL